MKITVKKLEDGHFLGVTMRGGAENFGTLPQASRSACTLGVNGEVVHSVIVADNPVTRALIDAIENFDSIETGNTGRGWYLAKLIYLLDQLWD